MNRRPSLLLPATRVALLVDGAVFATAALLNFGVRIPLGFAQLAFPGLRMVDPGVVLVSDWRPGTSGPRPLASEVNWYGGVARKP